MKHLLRTSVASLLLALPLIAGAQSGYITRADFVVNMMASKGLYGTGGHCFPDVTNQAFAPAVCEAKARGYVRGHGDGKFHPNANVTLIDAAVMAMRLEGVSLPSDAIWYRPAIEQLATWNAIPRTITSIVAPLSISQANEVLVAVRNRGDGDDRDEDDVVNDDDDDDLTVSITDSDDEVDAGDTVTYRIRIVNSDDRDVDVDVRAELDRDMIFVSASHDGEEDDDVVEWDDVNIDEDDDVVLKLTVRIRSGADGSVKLRVEADGEVDEERTRVRDRDDDDDDDRGIDLSVDDSGDPVRAGGTVTYRIRLKNTGNRDEEVDVRAELDRDMIFVSATDGGDEDDGVVEWDDVEVDEDRTKTILLTVRMDSRLDDGDRVRLRVRAAGQTETEETLIDRDDDDHDEDVEVSITDVEDPVREGQVITYRIQIRNNENNPIRISAHAFLDDDTSFVSASDGGDLEGDDEVEWRNIDVARDATKTLLLSVRPRNSVRDGDTVTLRVEVEDDEDTETTRIRRDRTSDGNDIRLSITDSRDPAEPGDTVVYRIRIENRDDDDAEVDIRARMDADMEYVSSSNGGRRSGSEVRWDNVDVDGNDDVVVTLTVRIRSSADDGDTVRLEVEADGEEDTETTRIED